MDTQIGTKTLSRIRPLSGIRVDKPDGRSFFYISADYVPLYKPIQRHRYNKAIVQLVKTQGADSTVFIEFPRHPIPMLRKRRIYARSGS